MGCLKTKENNQEGKIIKMTTSKQSSNRGKDNKKSTSAEEKLLKMLLTGIGIIAASVIGFGGWLVVSYNDLNREMGELKTSMADSDTEIGEQLNKLTEDVQKINQGLEGDFQTEGIYTRLSLIEQRLNMIPLNASETVSNNIQASIEPNEKTLVMLSAEASPSLIVGIDDAGNEYIAEDLINEVVLLTYTEGTQEVYFLGQFNDSYQWDGNCIINVYNRDNSLCIITDANYDDGKLIEYKQIFPNDNKNEWIYAERKCTEQENEGETFVYSWKYGQEKIFSSNNVKVEDIYSAENFYEKMNGTLLSYYNGNTSNGKYNDSTGNAYLINYTSDGIIKTLYTGSFKDGKFNDFTGNAWEIVFDSSNNINKYFYYKGAFKNGNRISDEGIEYITQEQIDEIINGMVFGSELNWNKEI